MAYDPVLDTSPASPHQRCFQTAGQSMLPAIWHGDRVQLKYTKRFGLGDTLVYLENKQLVAHRAVEMNDTTVWTRGDNQRGAPQAVPRTAVLGRVVAVTPPRSRWIMVKRKLWFAFPGTMKLACQVKQRVLRTF